MPLRSKVAHYWRDTSMDYFDYLMDWGEPSCWACRTYNSSLDFDEKKQIGKFTFKVWDNHYYLQRCHIVPKAFGGCSCEANLVLLCHRCHKASPDSRKPIHFINWVRNKKFIVQSEIHNLMTQLKYKPEEDDIILIHSEEFRGYYNKNSIVVGGSVALSTYLACFLEFKELNKKKVYS